MLERILALIEKIKGRDGLAGFITGLGLALALILWIFHRSN